MKIRRILRDSLISLATLTAAFALSIAFQGLDVEEHITTVFVFAVFLIALSTERYFYGVAASVVAMVAINYAFTFPYFAFDFIDPGNLVAAVIMVALAMITSLLATRLKRHKAAIAEGERERMRANLLRAVSHDLRTPLTTISSASTMLRENKAMLTPEQQDSMLRSIQEDAQWLVRMVENLLSVTRIDNTTMKITKVPMILDELVDSAVTKFASKYPKPKVSISLPDEIVVIPMDAILIEQVMINLLENAVHHARGMTVLSLRVYTQGDRAVFEIADDGCGIEESRLKHIFTGCYDLQRDTASEKKRFAGIGLSVCDTIIKAHGGTITAENRKTGGALFRFTLKKEDAVHDE